jgi:hypothetical protein
MPERAKLDAFVARWQGGEGGQERANYALFLSELCDVIGVERPNPATGTGRDDYVFERWVEERHADGTTAPRRIDLYKRDCFILEAKQSRQKGGRTKSPARPICSRRTSPSCAAVDRQAAPGTC